MLYMHQFETDLKNLKAGGKKKKSKRSLKKVSETKPSQKFSLPSLPSMSESGSINFTIKPKDGG